jgi:16S rRNA (cytosine1402-N4)-methyltransferase
VSDFQHLPAMGREVVELLLAVPPGLLVDGTVGGGGHGALLLDARPDWHYLAIDRDSDALVAARSRLARFGDRVEFVQAEFGHLAEVAGERGDIVGILLDLGVSSPQLDRPERGFSYRFDAPLDMRMDARAELSAATVVNEYSEDELAALIAHNGEERFARRIAREIVRRRPLVSTHDLVDAITAAIPAPARRRGGHPAKRTFQAIRMEVNRELPNLVECLDESVHLVGAGGRILVLAYHSLEDRIVKQRFALWAGEDRAAQRAPSKLPVDAQRLAEMRTAEPMVRIITKKPLRPRPVELASNPRAESARLRAVERLGPVAGLVK